MGLMVARGQSSVEKNCTIKANIGEVPSRSLIAKASHNERYEVQEWQWDIVGNEIALHTNCVFCNLLDKSHTLFMLLLLLPCHRSLKQPASVLQL